MEEPKENNSNKNSGGGGANIPEWVMHLLTGLGTMGAEYMMFIKPLQEKMELQTRLIKEQGEHIDEMEERIDELEDLVKKMAHKPEKKAELNDKAEKSEDAELFNLKRKPTGQRFQRQAYIKL